MAIIWAQVATKKIVKLAQMNDFISNMRIKHINVALCYHASTKQPVSYLTDVQYV